MSGWGWGAGSVPGIGSRHLCVIYIICVRFAVITVIICVLKLNDNLTQPTQCNILVL